MRYFCKGVVGLLNYHATAVSIPVIFFSQIPVPTLAMLCFTGAQTMHLVSDELVVDTICRHQFIMCPRLMHNTVLQTVDEVRVLDG